MFTPSTGAGFELPMHAARLSLALVSGADICSSFPERGSRGRDDGHRGDALLLICSKCETCPDSSIGQV
jgi:hypothetical protein